MSFLRDRAEEFLDNAKYNLGKGFYNLVVFDIEQFIHSSYGNLREVIQESRY